MAIFNVWDVIKVPFPYTDRPVREYRPAVVVLRNPAPEENSLLWVLMITSATHRPWLGDVRISDLSDAGLPAASIVRTAKIATIESKESARLGTLPSNNRRAVKEQIRQYLSKALTDEGVD